MSFHVYFLRLSNTEKIAIATHQKGVSTTKTVV